MTAIESITLRGPMACTITTKPQSGRNDNIIVVDRLEILRRPDCLEIHMATGNILTVWEYNAYSIVRYAPRPLSPPEFKKPAD